MNQKQLERTVENANNALQASTILTYVTIGAVVLTILIILSRYGAVRKMQADETKKKLTKAQKEKIKKQNIIIVAVIVTVFLVLAGILLAISL